MAPAVLPQVRPKDLRFPGAQLESSAGVLPRGSTPARFCSADVHSLMYPQWPTSLDGKGERFEASTQFSERYNGQATSQL